MRKKVYVDGGIVITTPYFKYQGGGCKFGIPAEDVDKIVPNDTINGIPCLVIKDKQIPSIFKEYYARDFFSTNTMWAPIFSKDIEEIYFSFKERIEDVKRLIDLNDKSDYTRQILYRLSLVSVVASLDTLISDLVIFATSRDNEVFLRAVDLLYSGNAKANILERILHMWCDNTLDSAEQDVFEAILKKSYSSSKEIQDFLNRIYGISISISEELKEAIHIRHIVAHRNGRKKDGSYYVLTKNELQSIILEVYEFGESLRAYVDKWCMDAFIDE